MTDHSTDVPKESSRTIIFQFVVFPLGVVLIGVLIFFLFGRLASDEQTIPDYLNEVKSGGQRERWQAAYQLSQLINAGEAKKYPNLVTQVSAIYRDAKHDDPRIRRYLSMVLGNLGDRRATPLLVEALADPDIETRIYAALALGRFGDRRAIGVVREMLDRSRLERVPGMRPDQKDATVLAAIPALLKIAPEEARTLLAPLAASDPSMQVRSAAKEALGQVR